MGQLPVQHRRQPVRADDQVAEPEVTVQQDGLAGRRRAGRQLGIGQLEDLAALPGLGEGVQLFAQAGERVRRREEGRIRFVRQPVQAGCELAELAHNQGAGLLVLLVAQDLARDRLAGYAAHDHARGAEPGRAARGEQQLGHREAGGVRQREGRRLPVDRAGLGRAPRRIAAQDQLGAGAIRRDGVERPGLLGRAAGQPPLVLDPGPASRPPSDGARELVPVNGIGHPAETPFGARWCMKPNMYPATRRIWISSAPSVIRYRR